LKKFAVIILLLLSAFTAPKIVAANADTTLFDNAAVAPRVPQKETIDEYLADDDFAYAREANNKNIGWVERFIDWILDGIKWFLKKLNVKDINLFSNIILYLLAAIAIAGIAYLIFKNELSAVWGRSKNKNQQGLNIQNIDLSEDTTSLYAKLQKAIADKNYAESIRLYYIITLKNLAEKGTITFRIDKTNNEYLYELPDGLLRGPFKQITYYFEYIYYGQYTATEAAFLKTQEAFLLLNPTKKAGNR
jgi:hypothetical protein